MAPAHFTADEAAAAADFRTSIGQPFQELYGARWDEPRWAHARAAFEARHAPHVVQATMLKMAGWVSWEQCRARFREGPPLFLREGWASPLLGRAVDLGLLDDGSLEYVQGDARAWRAATVLVVEFWATWCKPCVRGFPHLSALAAAHPGRVAVVGVNIESVFGDAPDVDIRAFVATQPDMTYIIAVDVLGRAQETLYQAAGRLSIPTALLITTADCTVQYVGHPNKMDDKLKALLE